MVDKNGVNILTPLFNQYANAMGDALYQSQQLSLVPYLEKCPIIFEEYYKAIDVRLSNKIPNTNRYIIENDIVGIHDLYYNAALTQLLDYNSYNYFVGHDESTNTRYVEFTTELDPRITTLFADKVYKDKFVLRDVFGKLLNYEKTFTFVEYWDNQFLAQYNLYKKELLGILYTSMHGQTFESIKKGLSIFIGLSFSPFDGIVKHINGNDVTIEDFETGKEQIVTCIGNTKNTLQVGTILNKYDIIDEDQFGIYDMFSDPQRFSQFLASNSSQGLINLLAIDINNKEQYAHLTFDSLVTYDETNIFWDMGNHTNVSDVAPIGLNNIPAPGDTLLSNMTTFNDSRFESLPIYEMFRNLFIIEYTYNNKGSNNYPYVDKTNYFLNRFKPIYTKYLIYKNSSGFHQLTAPFIIQQPQEYPKQNIGNNSIYNVIAGGSQPLSYQWQKINVSEYGNGGTWTNIGTNSPTANVQTTLQEQYIRVIISNQQGSVTSNNVLCL
jgi:hypothetical protein